MPTEPNIGCYGMMRHPPADLTWRALVASFGACDKRRGELRREFKAPECTAALLSVELRVAASYHSTDIERGC